MNKCLFLIGILSLFGAPPLFAQEVTFYHGLKETPLKALPYVKPPYVHLFQFLEALGGIPKENAGLIELELNGHKIKMDPQNSTAQFGQKVHSFPIRRKDGDYYVRVDTLSELFTGLLGKRLVYEANTQSLHMPMERDLEISVRSRQIGSGYRLSVSYSEPISRPVLKKEGKNLVLKINEKKAKIDRSQFTPNEAVQKMEVYQGLPDGTTEILFVLTDKTTKHQMDPFNPDNPRTIIKLIGEYTNLQEPQQTAARAPGLKRIVLDPGHGGRDQGAVGPTGLQEKAVTLDLALMLKKRIGEEYEVSLTREDDSLPSLKDRTAIANNTKADLFLSIHVNAINLPRATGSETYYLSVDADVPAPNHYEDEEVAEVVPEKPATAVEPTKDDLSLMLWDMAQSKYAEESFLFAREIQENLNEVSGIESRGVKQASLKVLKGAMMPAVLVEVAFISNPVEEGKLKTDEFREKIIESLYNAIKNYDANVQDRSQDRLDETDEDLEDLP